VTGEGLSIETDSGAAQEACESCGQCEIAYGVGLHKEFPFFGWARCFHLEVWGRYPEAGKSVIYDLGGCSSHVAYLRRESKVGYKRRKNLDMDTSEGCRGSSQNSPLMRFLYEKDEVVSRSARHLKALRER
jgi:hypothetical protein